MMGWRLQPHFLAIWIWTRRLASCNLWKQSNCLPLNPLQMKIFRLHSAVPCQAQDERNYFMICKLWLSFLHWAIKATFVFVQLSLPIQFHHSSGNSSILGHLQGMSSLPCDRPHSQNAPIIWHCLPASPTRNDKFFSLSSLSPLALM